jgi:RNA polymerase sigma factor (sigma-70 family)
MRPAPKIVNGIDVTAHAGLIWSIVRRYERFAGGILDREDLFQSGWLGVHEAAKRFEHERGLQFSTYASWWIRATIRRAIMDQRRTIRISVHAQEQAYHDGRLLERDLRSLDAPVHPGEHDSATLLDVLPSGDDPAQNAADQELQRIIEAALAKLPSRSRRILKARFWRDLELQIVGDDDGVSRERIRQIQRVALAKLERSLKPLQECV